MARKLNRRRVAEAKLFGQFQRRLDLLQNNAGREVGDAADLLGEVELAIVESEEVVTALGGDPDKVLHLVEERAAERLAMVRGTGPTPVFSPSSKPGYLLPPQDVPDAGHPSSHATGDTSPSPPAETALTNRRSESDVDDRPSGY